MQQRLLSTPSKVEFDARMHIAGRTCTGCWNWQTFCLSTEAA